MKILLKSAVLFSKYASSKVSKFCLKMPVCVHPFLEFQFLQQILKTILSAIIGLYLSSMEPVRNSPKGNAVTSEHFCYRIIHCRGCCLA